MAPRLHVSLSFFRLSQENPPSHRTCEVLSRSCRRILDTRRLEMFSRDHPIPRFPYLFRGYAMHYAIPCVSKKLLSRFSLAFCKYLRCFARQDDCTDTRYVYTRVLPIWFYILFLLISPHVYIKVASITNIIVKYKISCWNILLILNRFMRIFRSWRINIDLLFISHKLCVMMHIVILVTHFMLFLSIILWISTFYIIFIKKG